MNKKVFTLCLGLLVLTGCVNRDEIYANPPQELIDGVNKLMPAASEFVHDAQKEALKNGQPLTDAQIVIAKEMGVQHPEKVRVYYVDKLPAPTDPELLEIAKRVGYTNPNMAGYAYGYGIWIHHRYKNQRDLLPHELVHVKQAEELGLTEQTRQYLIQMFIYGYYNAPMEKEARQATAHLL
ncbi:hypothetical protein A1OW_19530 [Enterovibrio norvegicus]|uniref:DUF4157 domain-containing protein n=1 Tax=Enterovibrio norvegicus DSM 15893 TaxID=1121869 RepID=A0A1I5K043_9GAMM|nr:hypothetical protein [Enterovibrio norvegicus]OEF62008.1 hypothetical protein A1OW_19530 [Enterovibrio norvegicus]PMH72444.1 hypothetical protein BCU62_22630 [Enterovibrio norvegicus]SFO78434.1 hypothetical protein SAMN03084138_00452 [Enterovibrio norvegicus DSM 15893]